jgi:hypothetical protein
VSRFRNERKPRSKFESKLFAAPNVHAGKLSPIHLAAMPHFYDLDDPLIVVHRVKNSVIALTDAIDVISKELFATLRSRVGRQAVDPMDNPAKVSFRNAAKFFLGAALDAQAI